MCGSLDACARCLIDSADVCTLTVIEKFTVPGEHREAFGSNKKSFNSSGYVRRQHRPEPLLSGRGEPAAATAARRHHCLRSQPSTHPSQASKEDATHRLPRRPTFAGDRIRQVRPLPKKARRTSDFAHRSPAIKYAAGLCKGPRRCGTQQRVHRAQRVIVRRIESPPDVTTELKG